MTLPARWLIALAAAGAQFACSRAPAALPPAHADAIRDCVALGLAALHRYASAAQWDSLARLYSDAPGFRFAESGTIQYRSAEAIGTALRRLPPGTRIESTYRDTEIDPLAPGLAVLTTLFETAFVDSAGGRFAFSGAITLVWAHEPAGWRIRHGHSSAPVPRGR